MDFDAEVLDPEVRHLRCTGYVDLDELNAVLETYSRTLCSSFGARRLLDIGCAASRYGREIASLASWRYVGLDLSFDAIDSTCGTDAIGPVGNGAWAVCADVGNLPFPAEVMHGIFAVDVLHHVAEPIVAALECYRVSASGAPFFASVYSTAPEGGEVWSSLLSVVGYTSVSAADSSSKWQAWLRRKHEARLDQRDRLISLLGETNAERVLSVSRRLLCGASDIPSIDQMRRFLIRASK